MTYQLPSDMFKSVDDLQTYTTNWIQQEISHNPDISRIDVVSKDSNVENIDKLVTRRVMWIPNQYAELWLEEGLSRVDVSERLYVDLHQDGTLEACHPLVDYLQVQLRGNVEANEANEAHYDSD